ncbi:hypothetical protein AGABI1DRAFT_66540 [Agaricus bisporus var. burnettii JB137-S8]|uniref:BAR domain-containing protein n=1 Tax=Agaricus bisporus var. burnettii (strain JB137-S8 / ATCC MYA-4627 / FGSC 10392) TaxID=597362 RepID=K5XJZ5_AGABU|nr:uncharacterized protein AGABI1DRAFT_66540 [Agaricus bisporus var. burnettii JB137-S8]EKM83672.1 hypothetical protein AGABI1DRAFT_66540 [Agaricus bisporus var. burnettii JB137-S8]
MKGIGKALARTPFQVTSKIGMSKKSKDAEFDDLDRHFASLETAAERLIKETKTFCDAVTSLFTHGHGFATHFSTIFQPIAGEYDLLGKHSEAEHTIRSVTKHETAMEEMKTLVTPELELIESRILAPAKEVQTIMKQIRKTITKREHKLLDFDRFNNSLTKLRDKKEKSMSDEKNLFKLEQDFELASNDYDYINTSLKQDLPRFMQLSTQFIDPLFNSFFYMQLNIYYMVLEKMNSFADSAKYEITSMSGGQIEQSYEEKRTDAWNDIENLNIVKRIVSVSRLVQVSKSQNSQNSLQRAPSAAPSTASASSSLRAPPPGRSLSSAAAYKKAPPKPPSLTSSPSMGYAPPPYTPTPPASEYGGDMSTAKRAPPPPPPIKSKPKPKVAIQYVIALYDFTAQAEGDLSFNAGDRIELVQRTASSEDWWTGRVNGLEGVFPGKCCMKTTVNAWFELCCRKLCEGGVVVNFVHKLLSLMMMMLQTRINRSVSSDSSSLHRPRQRCLFYAASPARSPFFPQQGAQ